MWPFKKKRITQSVQHGFESVLCIPGNWESEDALKLAIVEATNGEYIAAGWAMIHVKEKCHFKLAVAERDEDMRRSFSVVGRVTGVSETFLDEIDRHNMVAYLLGPTGSVLAAQQIAVAARAILKAGGIGVKIETAGKGFERAMWYELSDDFAEQDLYEMFVVDSLSDSKGTTFSCGMQNLGLRDAIVSDLPFQDAVDLIRTFGYYQLIDKPEILPNQTFSVAVDSPVFRIVDESRPPYEGVELLGNPFGMWRLVKILV